jgi:antitoxin ParD1/3/4
MTITLTADQEARLKALVASGDFASIEEAAGTLLDERVAEREFENDDLAWAKPLVDEGLAALERGEFISIEEHKARNAARRDHGLERTSESAWWYRIW